MNQSALKAKLALLFRIMVFALPAATGQLVNPAEAHEHLADELFANGSTDSASLDGLFTANNYCTDSPTTRAPDSTLGHEVGDKVSLSWTNPAQGAHGCAYETKYEVQDLGGDHGVGWVMVGFHSKLQGAEGGKGG